ncbi:MAG: tetratricopeptide repeat protein [Verrucomicrobiota bacterium]|jgi:cytochrome c-type biogenesis protein CcmH/NrfG
MSRKTIQPAFHPPAAGASASGDLAQAWWQQGWFFFLLLSVAAFLAYQPVWHGGFLWDDSVLLTNNPLVKQADGWWRIWCESVTDYVPATLTTFWLEWRLWGGNPLGYHLGNILLHALAAFLAWKVLRALKIPGARLAAAIFALHPVAVESVAWIAERKNTLAMVFYLCALLWFLRFEDSGDRRWYWTSALAFVLALFSKTAVVPLPVVLLGMAWWRRGRIDRRDLLRSLLFFVLAAAGVLLALWIQRGATGASFQTVSFWGRLAQAGWVVWFYLGKAVVPLNLVPVYPLWHINAARMVSYLPTLAVAAVLAASWLCRKQGGRVVLAAFGYFLALLLPVMGFANISLMRCTLVADQWQYFALIGPVALLAAGATVAVRFLGPGKVFLAPAGVVVLLLALGVLTWRQSRLYTSPTTLWQATLAADPRSFLAQSSLGSILFKSGKTAEAIAHYEAALAIDPKFFDAHYDLANIFLQTGHPSDAVAHYEKVLQIQPDFPQAVNNLAWVLATCPLPSLRNGARAVELAGRAVNLSGGKDPSPVGTLAAAYAEAGRFDDAITAARVALKLAGARNDAAQVKDLNQQLACYQRGAPYRDPLPAGASANPRSPPPIAAPAKRGRSAERQ